MVHRLKLNVAYADAVLSGEKSFEIRYNDRGYKKGDLVMFNVVEGENCESVMHPLNEKVYEITYLLEGWGLKDGWCVFSIKEKKEK